MTNYIDFGILGFGSGSLYVAIALAIFTVYRATGTINFAQGAMAMWGAYVYARLRLTGDLVLPVGRLHIGSHVAWPLALLIGLVSGILIAILAQVLVFRPLSKAPTLAKVVASIAVMLLLQALVQIRFGANDLQVPALLPASNSTLNIAGLSLNTSDLLLGGISVVLCLLIWAFFKRTNLGIAMRASAANERGLALIGYSPNWLGMFAWVIGTVISTFIAILASPATSLDPVNYSLYVVPALAVLLLARLNSIWVIGVAGLLLGSFQSIITVLTSETWWPSWALVGIPDAVPFLAIVAALFFWGDRLPARGLEGTGALPQVRIPSLRPKSIVVPLVICVGALVLTQGSYRFGVITSIITFVAALSYILITGYVGQISFAQIAFAGASGFFLSKLTTSWNVPFPWSLLIAAGGAAVLGAIVAVPAIRIRGIQLAIVTIAAALTIQDFVFSNPSFTPVAGNQVGSPSIFGYSLAIQDDRDIATLQFGFMVIVVALLFVSLFIVFARGATGRSWLAIRSNERAAAAAGVNVRAMKLLAFSISAFMAGGAGALMGYSRGQLSVASFTVTSGLLLLAVTYLGGLTSISGALVAGAIGPLGIVYVLFAEHINFAQYYDLIAGLGLVVSAILNPAGIAGKTYEQWLWIRQKLPLLYSKPVTPSAAAPVLAELSSVERVEQVER